jgi:hypothetical protein
MWMLRRWVLLLQLLCLLLLLLLLLLQVVQLLVVVVVVLKQTWHLWRDVIEAKWWLVVEAVIVVHEERLDSWSHQ